MFSCLILRNLYLKSLAVCIGSKCIADICERFAKNYRQYRSGIPDLTIWNSETKQWKVIYIQHSVKRVILPCVDITGAIYDISSPETRTARGGIFFKKGQYGNMSLYLV